MVSLRPLLYPLCKNSLDKIQKYLLCDINTPNLRLIAGSLRSSLEKQKHQQHQAAVWVTGKRSYSILQRVNTLDHKCSILCFLVCVCLFICTFSSFALLSCMVETTELQFAMFSSSWLPLFHLIDNLSIISVIFTDLSSHSPLVISSSAFRISVSRCSSPGTSSNFILTDTLLKAEFTQLVKHSLW